MAHWGGTNDGIALHAGRSGLVIFDVDHPEKLPDVLARAIDECQPPYQQSRPDTPGRGHFVFAQPPGRTIGNGPGKLGDAWGQVRGLNGVIIAAPSIHENADDGAEYEWKRIGPVPVLPNYVADDLPDGSQAEDAATDETVQAFLDQHTGNARPDLLDRFCHTFTKKTGGGGSRHTAAVALAAGAMKEAMVGFYPAAVADRRLGALFHDAVTDTELPDARTESRAATEWAGIRSWAVGQAIASDPAKTVARVNDKVPPNPEVIDLSEFTTSSSPPPGVDPETGEKTGDDDQADPIDSKRMVLGGSFIFDQPEGVPAVWGEGDEVLWAKGEAVWIVGPPGVGKTTLIGQVVRGRLGLDDHAVAWAIEAGTGRVLYLAMDRPSQIARALRRHFTPDERQVLDERLVIWRGPPPADVAKHPGILLELCRQAGADTLIIDSVKDAALKLSDDETGSAVNRAIQAVTVEGIEVAALHHQRKGQGGVQPRTLEDVYGSTWLTAGAGSVLLLWGQAGDLEVELRHLKQPVADVGPLKLLHDHTAGITTVSHGFDPLAYLRHRKQGATAMDAARQMFEKQTPTENERKKAQRRLDRLVSDGFATRTEGERGGADGSTAAVYRAVILTVIGGR